MAKEKISLSETMGSRIQRIRKQKGLTQTDLAIAAGYSRLSGKTSIARIESGEGNLTLERLRKIANVLDVDPAYLEGKTDRLNNANGRPEFNRLIRRLENDGYDVMLTDHQIEKLHYQLSYPSTLDINLNEVLIEMLSNRMIKSKSNGTEAVIRYGRLDAPDNQCEYSVFLSENGNKPIIEFKVYVNRYIPVLLVKYIQIFDENYAFFKDEIKKLLKQTAEVLKLQDTLENI